MSYERQPGAAPRRFGKGCACSCLLLFLLLAVVGGWLGKLIKDSVPESSSSTTSETASESTSQAGDGETREGIGSEILFDDGDTLGEEASLARNFYVVFDGSGSMARSPGSDCSGSAQHSSKIAGAQWALKEFLAKVPEDVNVGLYVFDRNGREERVALGLDNRQELQWAIDAIVPSRGTPLAKSIVAGTDRLVEQYKKQLGYGEFRLVVVTDGQASGIPDAVEYASQRGIPIYAIGLCIGQDHPLRELAVSYRAADSFEDMAGALEETLAELPTFDATDFEELP